MASTSLVANNHVQDQADTGAALIAVAWTLFGLSASVVGLRLWTRLFRVRHVAIDDYLMIVSLVIIILPKTRCCSTNSLGMLCYAFDTCHHRLLMWNGKAFSYTHSPRQVAGQEVYCCLRSLCHHNLHVRTIVLLRVLPWSPWSDTQNTAENNLDYHLCPGCRQYHHCHSGIRSVWEAHVCTLGHCRRSESALPVASCRDDIWICARRLV